MNNSIWEKYIDDNSFKKLEEDITVDILIIGGSLTGLNTAYNLKDSNLRIALLEKNKIGCGVTLRTTAKITYLQELIYTKLSKYFNKDTAKLYLSSQIDAIKILTDTIKTNKIDCDLEKVDSYLYTEDINNKNKLIKEKELLTEFGKKVSITTTLPDNTSCKYAIKVDDTYVFNPIKYINWMKNILKDKINIYEDSKVEKIIKEVGHYICKTRTNTIRAKYVVLALHYPYFIFPYMFPFKVTLEKSYTTSKKVDKYYNFSAINIDKPTKSIRYHKDSKSIYKIELTNSHNIAVKNNEEENFASFRSDNDFYWSNIDIITDDYLPFIGEIDNNLLIGTGYNTWGMTNSTIAGHILSDFILSRENKYYELFKPKRGMNLARIISFPVILSSNMYSFTKSKLKLNKSWYRDVTFEVINGRHVATYKDDEGIFHKVYPICPHLGCNLFFNEKEKTWDCPCHGSRFNMDGISIEGPANYNISYKDSDN